jgi:hypothetical protein
VGGVKHRDQICRLCPNDGDIPSHWAHVAPTPDEQRFANVIAAILRVDKIDVELIIRAIEGHARNDEEETEDDHRLLVMAAALRAAQTTEGTER